MIAYVRLGGREWSIANDPIDGFEWWCGEDHEWVSPHSDYWQLFHDCWNYKFKSLAAARRFARAKGWET